MPEKKTRRIKLALANEKSKAFTSKGPLVHGSVVTLPTDEAQRFIELGCAHLSDDDEVRIEPDVNLESGGSEPEGESG